ncbi:MAG TPA: bifunctional riboflavin kinase/FAD synthetase [Moraxellaceae bacterium]|nr:bifunctional riboflavin kinase/FAD synthetase [Moraxellaceae bacterium]
MELIRGLHNLRPRHHGSVVTLGNFDGVHLGHQAILRRLQEAGARLQLPDTVMIFEPQPQEFFQGDAAPARLMHWRDKVEALAAAGVSRVLCVRFSAAFRALTARQFIDELLVRGLGCRHLVIGDDFRFGCDRSGDFALLQAAGAEQGFTVQGTPTIEIAGERVSSTRIRAALKAADFVTAEELLGRPYRVSGHVVHGDKLGRTLGVPTANVLAQRQVSPLSGIYAVTVHDALPQPVHGVCSVGKRPTVNGLDERFETYLLDFAGDLYGHRIHLEFHHKIRDELKFDSLDELKVAMQKDIADTRHYFGI